MSSADYDLFQTNTLLLAKTLTVGHKMVSESINNYLVDSGYDVSDDINTHKYYMNLAGEYHESDYDYISSVNPDGHPFMRIRLGGMAGPYYVDLVRDLFHSANADPALAAEYRFGTRGYETLKQQYPLALDLIRGILYPIDKEVSMNAEDGAILQIGGYQRKFVDGDPERYYFQKSTSTTAVNLDMIKDREVSLINDLEKWVKNIFDRWLVTDYVMFNEYYVNAILGLIQATMPAKINVLRLARVGTSEVNTFHVKQKLNDLGWLGDYVDILPEEVYMWLYRNADYLDSNRGKISTLRKLIDNVLTPLKVPVTEHRLVVNTTETQNGLPTAEVQMIPLNGDLTTTSDDRLTVDEELAKTNDVASENHRDLVFDAADIRAKVLTGSRTAYPTRVIESRWAVYGRSAPISFEEFLLAYWAYNSASGNIGGFVFVHDPLTDESIPMSNEAAIYLAIYLYAKGFADITLTNIPKFSSLLLPKTNKFSIAGHDPQPNTAMLFKNYQGRVPLEKIVALIGTVTPAYQYSSASDFFKDVNILYEDLIRRYNLWSIAYTARDRAYLKRMCGDLYWKHVQVTPSRYGQSYSDFILTLGINVADASRETCRQLFYTVFRTATGNTEMTEDQYRTLHNALMSIIKQFMSYPLEIIHTTLVGDLEVRNSSVIRSSIQDNFFIGSVRNDLPRILSKVTPFCLAYKVQSIVPRIVSNARIRESMDHLPTRDAYAKTKRIQSSVAMISNRVNNNSPKIISAITE